MAALPPETVEVDGLSLCRLAPQDSDDLLAHFSDPQVTEFLDFPPLAGMEEAQAIIAWATDLFEAGRGIRWAIRAAGSPRLIGTCGFNRIVRQHGSRGEIAYDLARSCWGRGIMSSVMPCLLEIGFHQLGLRRLEAFVTPGNDRSTRLLERHGFRHEGRLRDYGRWCGAFWDQDLFALLEPEWTRGPRAVPERRERQGRG